MLNCFHQFSSFIKPFTITTTIITIETSSDVDQFL